MRRLIVRDITDEPLCLAEVHLTLIVPGYDDASE